MEGFTFSLENPEIVLILSQQNIHQSRKITLDPFYEDFFNNCDFSVQNNIFVKMQHSFIYLKSMYLVLLEKTDS